MPWDPLPVTRVFGLVFAENSQNYFSYKKALGEKLINYKIKTKTCHVVARACNLPVQSVRSTTSHLLIFNDS